MIRLAGGLADGFYRNLVVGFAILYLFQTFLTVGGGSKFIPLTGVTPVSYTHLDVYKRQDQIVPTRRIFPGSPHGLHKSSAVAVTIQRGKILLAPNKTVMTSDHQNIRHILHEVIAHHISLFAFRYICLLYTSRCV